MRDIPNAKQNSSRLSGDINNQAGFENQKKNESISVIMSI
jgi:hypothetical protein